MKSWWHLPSDFQTTRRVWSDHWFETRTSLSSRKIAYGQSTWNMSHNQVINLGDCLLQTWRHNSENLVLGQTPKGADYSKYHSRKCRTVHFIANVVFDSSVELRPPKTLHSSSAVSILTKINVLSYGKRLTIMVTPLRTSEIIPAYYWSFT